MDFIKKRPLPALILVLLISSIFLYHNTINLFPAFIHSWSQADRYSLALGFLNNGFDLFHPQTFDLETVNGITRVDFPVSEYIIAFVMKLLGTTSPAVFRIYTLCISLIGLVYLYLLSKKITASEIKSWLIVFFVFLSPVYVYYQNGFIPTIPALAFTFIAYYHFFSYKENGLKRSFYYSIFFFLLAALIRTPFIIFLIATLLQQGWMSVKGKRINLFELVAFIFAFGIFAAYFKYNLYLSRIYGSIFLDHLMPPKSLREFKEILLEMYKHWGTHYFTKAHYLLLLLSVFLCVSAFVKRKFILEKNKKYWFNLFIIFCGTTIYFLFMARQFYSHDYYFLDSLFIPVVFLFIFSLNTIDFNTSKREMVLSVITGISVILFFMDNQKVQAERYSSGPWDRTEITRQNFIGTNAFLDSIGVPKDAKILVIDAYTYNVPFILMGRKGYPILGTNYKNISTSLFWCKWDYVVIQDVYLVSDVIKNYPLLTSLLERINGNGKISIYKKSEKLHPKTLKQFLGISPQSIKYETNMNFDTAVTDTSSGKANATTVNNVATLYPSVEYGTTVDLKASDLKETSNLKALVNCDFLADKNIDGIQLVAAITNSKETVSYQSFALTEYFKPLPAWQKMEFQFVLPAFKTPDDELKIYLWNPAKATLIYDNWSVIIYK